MKALIGTGVALVTPFTETGAIDFPALKRIVRYQIDNGIDYLVVLGTTGESVTLSPEEKKLVLESLETAKNTYSSVLGEPAIVTAPLSAVTSKSYAVPLCAFAVACTAVPNAVFKLPLSASAVPASFHATFPVFVLLPVKNA